MREAATNLLITVLTATIPVITVYLIKFIQKKSEQLLQTSKSTVEARLIKEIETTIEDVVIATNQTLVEVLKKKGEFDPEMQVSVRDGAVEEIISMLSKEAREFIIDNYGDIHNWIITKVEATVNK